MIQEERTTTLNIISNTYVEIIDGKCDNNGNEEKGLKFNAISIYTESIIEFVGNLSVFVKGGSF